jgi:hypothetical protein
MKHLLSKKPLIFEGTLFELGCAHARKSGNMFGMGKVKGWGIAFHRDW